MAGSQASSVQTLPSSHTGAGPPTHVPALQVSAVVQALPSSQGSVLFTCWQPPAGSHRSVGQGLPSSPSRRGPAQVPLPQVSPDVQASPSSQAVPSALVGFEQAPVAASQVPATWHWSLAVQRTGSAPTQAPAWQVSLCVHASPSLQVVPFALLGFEQTPV